MSRYNEPDSVLSPGNVTGVNRAVVFSLLRSFHSDETR